MPSSNVEVVEIGIPGPPGGGVTPAELAGLMPKTGGTFIGAVILDFDSTGSFIVRQADDEEVLIVNATAKEIRLPNSTKVRGYSDDETTETWSVDSATGNIQTDGIITVAGGRVVGDKVKHAWVIDNAGVAITTGVKIDYPVMYPLKWTGWELVADQVGSIVIDIWMDSYANFPPTVADTITTSEKPTLAGVQKNTDTSLNSGNGWTLTEDYWLRFNVDSVATITRCTLKLFGVRL